MTTPRLPAARPRVSRPLPPKPVTCLCPNPCPLKRTTKDFDRKCHYYVPGGAIHALPTFACFECKYGVCDPCYEELRRQSAGAKKSTPPPTQPPTPATLPKSRRSSGYSNSQEYAVTGAAVEEAEEAVAPPTPPAAQRFAGPLPEGTTTTITTATSTTTTATKTPDIWIPPPPIRPSNRPPGRPSFPPPNRLQPPPLQERDRPKPRSPTSGSTASSSSSPQTSPESSSSAAAPQTQPPSASFLTAAASEAASEASSTASTPSTLTPSSPTPTPFDQSALPLASNASEVCAPSQLTVPQAASQRMASPGLPSPSMASPGLPSPSMASTDLRPPVYFPSGNRSPPGTAAPGLTAPQMPAPQMAAPRMARPGLAAPQMAAPRIAVPGLTQMAALQMAALQMVAPRMAVPGRAGLVMPVPTMTPRTTSPPGLTLSPPPYSPNGLSQSPQQMFPPGYDESTPPPMENYAPPPYQFPNDAGSDGAGFNGADFNDPANRRDLEAAKDGIDRALDDLMRHLEVVTKMEAEKRPLMEANEDLAKKLTEMSAENSNLKALERHLNGENLELMSRRKRDEEEMRKLMEKLTASEAEHEMRTKDLNERIKTLEEERLCAICMERIKDTVFDCGHAGCEQCGAQIRACHICRKTIKSRWKFFLT